MRKSIYVVLIILTTAIFVGTIRYCTRSNPEKSSIVGTQPPAKLGIHPTTLKLLFPLDKPVAQAEVIQAVEAKLAKDGLPIKLEFTYIPFNQYWNKVWLIAASGEPYDIALSAFSNISDFVSKKVLAPLDDALHDYGQDIVKSTPDYAFQGVTINGHIYGVPRVMPISEFQSFVQIRGDLRKKYGLPEIKTVADMDLYLATIHMNEPAITPYFYDTGRFLLREYGDVAFFAGAYLNAPVYIDPADPQLKVRSTYESDFFENIMAKMHEWQGKGYIPYGPSDTSRYQDPELAFNSGKIAATWSVVLKQTERIDAFKAMNPDGELENVYLHPEKPKYLFTGADNILSVFSTSQHVNESVAFLNWLRSSQENYDLFTYGIKDVNYKLQDGAIDYDGIAPEHQYTPISWTWNDIRFVRFSKYISPAYSNQLRSWDKEAIASPTLGFMPDLAPIKSEIAQLNVIITEYLPLLYDAKVDWAATMESFRAKLKDAGMNHVITEIQKQYDAYRVTRKGGKL
ncbi:ABC transporter substrate-binding protein [Paenibacillus marchantiophytorum]|uniref:ABC transporter substrate-binding protein n=1 Tax=Paenibacillus marchantiophytorum TaxID=1619310 RepID=A0ABQ2BU85_9BACL|nr:ABC transporter substrate-binding protein [Paenibacillus marchantiophytorum]GGI46519.1 ABC transporter substrate-binding protein [Paenibacillus marchantiophytorum]